MNVKKVFEPYLGDNGLAGAALAQVKVITEEESDHAFSAVMVAGAEVLALHQVLFEEPCMPAFRLDEDDGVLTSINNGLLANYMMLKALAEEYPRPVPFQHFYVQLKRAEAALIRERAELGFVYKQLTGRD